VAFQLDKFKRTEYEPRTAEVKVKTEAIQALFDAEDKKVFVVKGLSNVEIARTHAARDTAKNREALLIASEASEAVDVAEAIKGLMELNDDTTPAKAAFYLETFRQGLVEPKMEFLETLKFSKVAAFDVQIMANEILELTGLGYCEKKTRRSTRTAKSVSPSS